MSETKRRRRKVNGVVGVPGPAGPTPEEIAEALSQHDLEVGQRVRFRRGEAGDWLYGHVHHMERDGSVGLFSQGRLRSILPEHIQSQRVGPRGGRTWEPIT